MKILVIGSGGREHALTWKLRESQHMDEIYCAPGNAGMAQEAECCPVDVSKPQALLELARDLKVDLTVVGPEAPLVAGVVDLFERVPASGRTKVWWMSSVRCASTSCWVKANEPSGCAVQA